MKKFNKKVLALIMSILTVFTVLPFSGLSVFASADEIVILNYDDSNPYDESKYINEADAPKVKKSIKLLNNQINTSKTTDLPESYDSRDVGAVTAVKNQGSTGTCWAHAAISALESYDIIHNDADVDDVNYSEAHLVWFGLNPNSNGANRADDGTNIGTSSFSNGGNWRYVANAIANGEGINVDSDYPLLSDVNDMQYAESERYSRTADTGLQDVTCLYDDDSIKETVMSNGSVTCAFYYNTSYLVQKTINGVTHYSYYCPTATTINHSVTIIGWDDNYSSSYFSTDPGSNGAWLIKDSWGTNSKEQGYFWLSYKDASISQVCSWSTCDTSEFINNYSYTSSIFKSTASNFNTYASAYVSGGYERIENIGIFNVVKDATATITVYKNLSSTGNPDSGTRAGSVTRYLAGEGYYTFDFGNIALSKNERFGIVVTVTSSNRVDVPMETSSIGTFSCQKYQSYLKMGSSWADLYDYDFGNTFIYVNTSCNHSSKSTVYLDDCTLGGYTDTVCTRCNKLLSHTEIAPKAHNLVTEHVDATCVDGGYELTYCTDCKYTFREETEASGHNWITEHIDPTCYEDGYTKVYCDKCGEIQYELWFNGGHKIVKDPYLAPTCSSYGHTAGAHCSVCGYVLTPCDLIQKLPHTLVTDEGVPVTCTSNGLTEGCHCSVCGEVIEPQEVIQGYGSHDYYCSETVPATCTEDGHKTYKCSRCNDSYTEVLPMTGHTAGEEISYTIPATCTEGGMTYCEIRCVDCNEVLYYSETPINPLGHKYLTLKPVPATCTETGLTYGKYCEHCGLVVKEQTVTAARGHSYKTTVVAPTCTKEGYTLHRCSRCGDSYKTNIVKAKGHNWGPSTQTGGGSYKHTCSNCGYTEHYQVKSQFATLIERIQTFFRTVFRIR